MNAANMQDLDLPQSPEFNESDWKECAGSGDYRRIAFGWYKHVGQLAHLFSSIHPDSSGIAAVPPLRWAVLTGLLRRCARLMLSNLFLGSKRPLREATSIIDRCIFESAVKLIWLSEGDVDQRLRWFFLESLKTDLDLKDEINRAIESRGGAVEKVERRMINTMAGHVAAAGLTDSEVRESKDRMPRMPQMLREIRMHSLANAVQQRQGSHSVHGTWVHLLQNFLAPDENGRLLATREERSMHVLQLISPAGFVLFALYAFVDAVAVEEDELRAAFRSVFDEARAALDQVYGRTQGDNFEIETPA
jgi:hypothetical protein